MQGRFTDSQSLMTLNPTSRSLNPPALVSIVLVFSAVIFFALIRYRLRDMPLERDEGEYAYAGQLLRQGIPPYKLAYNMKLPGIYVAYALVFSMFGETPAGIHLGLLVINATTTLLLYLLTVLLFSRLAGVIAACCYALLSTSSSVLGFQAHATNFVVLPAIAGLLLLLHALNDRAPWLFFSSGVLSGIAFLMKQHGIFFVLFCFLYLVSEDLKQKAEGRKLARDTAIFGAGVVLPYAVACVWLYRAGVFREFWFWTVSYAGEYSKMGLHRAVRAFLESFRMVATPAIPIWILAAIGMTAPWWNPTARGRRLFLIGFFACSFLALCPGAYFRLHYFVLVLPAVAILAGVAVASATEELEPISSQLYRALPILILLVSFGYAVVQQRTTYFSHSPTEVFRQAYPESPFLAAASVANYIEQNSAPNAQIAVLGSEPEIYFYAHRHSATGYLYMYSLIVRQKYTQRMRQQMMEELYANHPDFLVYVDVWDSWGDRNAGPQTTAFLSALRELMDRQYERVGVADIGDNPGKVASFVWGDAARGYQPRSAEVIYVLRRKQDSPLPNRIGG
jgi:4-amino-4-deoxy-L-arabinose transferase-like glycosyltransferase